MTDRIYISPLQFSEDAKREKKKAIEALEKCKKRERNYVEFRVNEKTVVCVPKSRIRTPKQRQELTEKYNRQ